MSIFIYETNFFKFYFRKLILISYGFPTVNECFSKKNFFLKQNFQKNDKSSSFEILNESRYFKYSNEHLCSKLLSYIKENTRTSFFIQDYKNKSGIKFHNDIQTNVVMLY